MTVRILAGHCVDVLAGMEAASVHMTVCSPPYWNLRAYQTAPQIWPELDGRPPCADGAHEWASEVRKGQTGGDGTTSGLNAKRDEAGKFADDAHVHPQSLTICSATCQRCGSWRGELGSEPTVQRYLDNLLLVFRAVRRVLRDDGSCWVNLAGTFYNNPGGQNGGAGNTLDYGAGRISPKAMAANKAAGRQQRIGAGNDALGLKPLDWIDVPGLFARRMQQDGWTWRADMSLVKKAPLPESVTGTAWVRHRVKVAEALVPHAGETNDRTPHKGGGSAYDLRIPQWADCPGCPTCAKNDGYVLRRGNWRPTRASERLLLFTKGSGAFFDQEAVRVPQAEASAERYQYAFGGSKNGELLNSGQVRTRLMGERDFNPAGRNPLDWLVWNQREPLVKLRSDLTPEQRAYVLQRIADAGSVDA